MESVPIRFLLIFLLSFISSYAEPISINAFETDTTVLIAAQENGLSHVSHMYEQVDLEEAEEELSVLEKVAQALRNMAGLREDERQGRSRNRNATGTMAKRENSPERNHDAKVAQAEDWSLSKIEQLFEHSRKSFDAVKPGEIENLMWAKAGVTLIEGITACVDSLDDWSGTMLSAAADLLDKAADTARTAIRRTARDDLGISQKNAQDLGDGTALAVGLMTMRPVIKSARFLGQTAKEAKLIKGANNSSKLGFRKELAKDYIREIEKATGYNIPDTQRLLLKKDLQQNKYVKLEGKDKSRHRMLFNNDKDRLRREWVDHTKQDWPTYKEPYHGKRRKTEAPVRDVGDYYDVHELIPNSHGGPLEWWNVHPARFPDQHQRIIHGKDSVINKILKELGDK